MFARKSVRVVGTLLFIGVLVVALLVSFLIHLTTTGAFAVFQSKVSATQTTTQSTTQTTSPAITSATAPAITPASTSSGHPNNDCPPPQSLNGSSNDATWVKVIEYRLNYAIFPTGFPYFRTHPWLAIDGSFGQKTYDAVVAYQAWEGISGGGGVVGSRTWASLGFCQSSVANAFTSFGYTVGSNAICPPKQSENNSGNTSEFVQAAQDLLNQDYFNHPKVYSTTSPKTWHPYLRSDGSFGSETDGAVYDYQSSNGVTNGGGVVGERTWAMLGLCYYTSAG